MSVTIPAWIIQALLGIAYFYVFVWAGVLISNTLANRERWKADDAYRARQEQREERGGRL